MKWSEICANPTGKIFSRKLSAAMEAAGFHQQNARIQSGQALALEEMLRSATNTDQFYVFGSFCDGWGSCLSRLDGRIDEDSDVDITFFLPLELIHLRAASCPSCMEGHQAMVYHDGHVKLNHNVPKPNLDIPKSDAASAFDLIFAVSCCGYARIELLQPHYTNHKGLPSCMPQRIMQLLRKEVEGNSPRCHAVTAAPPGQALGFMRVSTTLLERSVMHNLTTVQGQFFILIKFLIKKEISSRVSGLKTYMAKNLLFYMLDETPEKRWKPENLLKLVRRSLQLLIEMMKSFDSNDVCMKHFFLRDANVYFKKDHSSKLALIDAVEEILTDLRNSFDKFLEQLPSVTIESVEFHIFFSLIGLLEILSSSAIDQYEEAYKYSIQVYNQLFSSRAAEVADAMQQRRVLESIEKIPACASIVKRMLRTLALKEFGMSMEEKDAVTVGIPTSSISEIELSVDQAKVISLDYLKRSGMLAFELNHDRTLIIEFPLLQDLASGIPSVLVLCYAASSGSSLLSPSLLQDVVIAWNLVSQSRLLRRLLQNRPQILERLMYRSGELKELFGRLLANSSLGEPLAAGGAVTSSSTSSEGNVHYQTVAPVIVVTSCFIRETRVVQLVCLQLSMCQLIEVALNPRNANN